MSEPPLAHGIRASDGEREVVAEALRTAYAEGRLDVAELDARLSAALTATYRDQLPALLGDLPAGASAPRGSVNSSPGRWPAFPASILVFVVLTSGVLVAHGAPPFPAFWLLGVWLLRKRRRGATSPDVRPWVRGRAGAGPARTG